MLTGNLTTSYKKNDDESQQMISAFREIDSVEGLVYLSYVSELSLDRQRSIYWGVVISPTTPLTVSISYAGYRSCFVFLKKYF